ncbi:MAG TPA: hypothetical protein VMT46_13175 [Anaerolineaceae bacterium]|nr:hypothetical protein [Anaerolineaceae bacterium]
MTTIRSYDDRKEIEALGELLLEGTTQPVPRFRLVRDVLRLSTADPPSVEARTAMLESRWVGELKENQHADGTWGRFHSRDSSLRSRFPTTELAIYRALALGLDPESDVLKKAAGFCCKVLAGEATWSDPPEKHEGWPVNIRFITAGTLARIDARHPAVSDPASIWTGIVERTFQSGTYDATAERAAHLALNGIRKKGKYLKLAGLYPLLLLSSPGSELPPALEQPLLKWVWNKEDGIYYVYGGCLSRPPQMNAKEFSDWMDGLEIISRFGSWRVIAREGMEWIWRQRGPDCLWDFGPAVRRSPYFPLAESWRRPGERKVDCSVRILALLRKYLQDGPA